MEESNLIVHLKVVDELCMFSSSNGPSTHPLLTLDCQEFLLAGEGRTVPVVCGPGTLLHEATPYHHHTTRSVAQEATKPTHINVKDLGTSPASGPG